MTGYIFSIGYLSGYSFSGGPEDAWKQLAEVVQSLSGAPALIVHEVISVEGGDAGELFPYAERYTSADATLRVNEDEHSVLQCASGSNSGDMSRAIKEKVRRGFCRLVIREMHKRGIEVNLQVA